MARVFHVAWAMENFFHTRAGQLSLILGGADLALLGVASLAGDTELAAGLLAVVPMLSIAIGIYIVALSTFEVGGLLPIGLFSIMLLLAGVYAFGLTYASSAGPASGAVLISVGTIFALLGVRPESRAVEHTIESRA